MKTIFTFLLLCIILGCSTVRDSNDQPNDIQKIIGYFIKQNGNAQEDEEILLIIQNSPWEKDLYLVNLIQFDKFMYLGKFENIKALGRYKYKGDMISVYADKNIPINLSKWGEFVKVSDKSFVNEEGLLVIYDPPILKFYVDKNFHYVKQLIEDSRGKEIKALLQK